VDRLAWLKERQTGIGSSDAPNLVGVGFRAAADVYRSKVEPAADDRAPLLDLGTALEPFVASRYAEVMGVELAAPAAVRRHPDRPWQLANVDRFRDDDVPVELKTVAGFGEAWGEPGSDEIPPGYRVQVQHQMGVVGAAWCDVAALCRITGELRVYRVAFDAGLYAWLTAVEERFWRMVEGRTPPGPGWEAEFAPAAERLLTVPGSVVDLGPDAARLLDRRKALADIRDEAGAEYDRLTAQVRAAMGTAERATAGPWTVKVVAVKEHVVKEHTKAASSYIRCTLAKGK